jgi:hypothetical protein
MWRLGILKAEVILAFNIKLKDVSNRVYHMFSVIKPEVK